LFSLKEKNNSSSQHAMDFFLSIGMDPCPIFARVIVSDKQKLVVPEKVFGKMEQMC
jgi:hypothetical protein